MPTDADKMTDAEIEALISDAETMDVFDEDFSKRAVAALRELRALRDETRWIPVGEWPVKMFERVLLFTDYRELGGGCAVIKGYYFDGRWSDERDRTVDRVTHVHVLSKGPGNDE